MKTLTILFFVFHFSFFVFHSGNAQIPFQGLHEDHEGAAAWNANGSGPETEAYGHIHPFGWGSSLYYGASRDYDDIDPHPDAALGHFLDNIIGFPLFVQALADYGFSPGQVKIKIGIIDEKNDLEGEDWFTFNNKHYLNKYDGYYIIELAGEPMISCYISYMFFTYDSAIYNNWQFQSNFAIPVYASDSASSQVQAVAAAFLQDMDGEELRMTGDMTSTGTPFYGNGRVSGEYFDIVSGLIEKGQPELPFAGPASAHEGIAGWNADGSGPEPAAEGHSFYYNGDFWWMAYYIASRDYDGIDPDPGAAFCHVTGVGTGFPNLEIQMAYRGYTMDQLKVKSGIATLGNDIEGVDWWLDGNIEYYHSYGNKVTVEIAGEPILEYANDTNFSSSDLDMDGHWLSYSTFSPVEDISTNASPNAQFVALSFLKDIGGRFVKAVSEGGFVDLFDDSENGRNGAFHKVDSGYLTLGTEKGTFIEAGEVSGTWTAENSPYMINGNIIVPNGQTLTIESGVIVAIRGPYYIRVDGCVLAEGAAEENILFTHSNPTVWWDGFDYQDTPSTNDTSRFSHCTFQYGCAQGDELFNNGGVVAVTNFSKLKITDCIFQYNKADLGNQPMGGAIGLSNSSPVITNSTFRNNSCSYAGGAIICYNGSHPDLVNNIFTDNVATGFGVANSFGGAIICSMGSNPVISSNTFSYNTADIGGALDIHNNSSPQVDHNLIYGNVANDYGGAFSIYLDCSPMLLNNTIAINVADTFGGGIAIEANCFPVIRNTIIWGNTASEGSQVQINSADCVPDFFYSDLEGGADSIGGTGQPGEWVGCIDNDPLFEGSDTCYYHLTEGSPCIDAGDPDCTDPIDSTICDMGAFWCNYLHVGIPTFPSLASGPNTTIQLKIYPNPCSDISHFVFRISKSQFVTLKINDLYGREVRTLVDEEKSPGEYTVRMDVSNLPAGVYLVRLQAGEQQVVSKLLVQ
jgi:hypothetical protein